RRAAANGMVDRRAAGPHQWAPNRQRSRSPGAVRPLATIEAVGDIEHTGNCFRCARSRFHLLVLRPPPRRTAMTIPECSRSRPAAGAAARPRPPASARRRRRPARAVPLLLLLLAAASPLPTALAAQVRQVASRPDPASAEHVATVEGISEYRLPNGLRIVLFPDPSRP